MTVTYLSPYGVWCHTCSSTPMTRTPSHRAGSLISRRVPSTRAAVLAALPGDAEDLGMRATRELGARIGCLAHILTPHVSALLAPVAAHAHVQNRGTPPAGLVRQAPDHRVTANALAPAALAPPILSNNAACQHCMVWLNALAGHFQAKVIQARERAQVGAIKGSIGHVEVFRMDGVGISIIERPRPLPGHDTPNSAQYPYTPKCEEPVWVACHWGRNACVKGVTRVPVERFWTWKRP